jgi:hypothetical protein
MVVAVASDTLSKVLLDLNEILVGGVGHEQFVFLLAKVVPPSTVLIDEVGVADRGQALRIGEPHCHGRIVC